MQPASLACNSFLWASWELLVFSGCSAREGCGPVEFPGCRFRLQIWGLGVRVSPGAPAFAAATRAFRLTAQAPGRSTPGPTHAISAHDGTPLCRYVPALTRAPWRRTVRDCRHGRAAAPLPASASTARRAVVLDRVAKAFVGRRCGHLGHAGAGGTATGTARAAGTTATATGPASEPASG